MKKVGMLLGVRQNDYSVENQKGETIEGTNYVCAFALKNLEEKATVQGYDIMVISAKEDCFDLEECSAAAIWQKYGNRYCQVVYSYNERFKKNKCEMILLDPQYQEADFS